MKASVVIAGVVALGGIGAYLYFQQQNAPTDTADDSDPAAGDDADTTLGNIVSAIQSTVAGWKSVGSAAQWLPVLGAAETSYGLPADLLSRMAYQESHFREEIIRGTMASPAGALGILQLMPRFFQTVTVPTPFTDDDVSAQIDEAAAQVHSLYQQFGAWDLALAAYNAGAGNVKKYGGIPPFTETQNYVAQITADVPSIGAA